MLCDGHVGEDRRRLTVLLIAVLVVVVVSEPVGLCLCVKKENRETRCVGEHERK